MKRTVFILIGMALCLVLADKVQAQRCLPGMKGLRLTAGMADGDAFVYGGAVSLEIETYLTNRTVLLLHARERCLWGGGTGNFHFQFGVGLKFILD